VSGPLRLILFDVGGMLVDSFAGPFRTLDQLWNSPT